jgi:6-phosphogluconolactonase
MAILYRRTLLLIWISFVSIATVTLCAAQTTGAVYLNTNSSSNALWAYTRASDGTLTFAGSFATQGAGSGSGNLGSQGAIILSRNRKFLFVVNAGSNEITSFRVQPGGTLVFASKVASGGTFPNSLTFFGNLLYVLNAGAPARISAFRVNSSGVMTPVAGSARRLSASDPNGAQVGFSPNGKLLVVAEISSNKIDTYTVGSDGTATGPKVQNSAGPGPFGFAFDNAGHLIISEVTMSSASSYSLSPFGVLTTITGNLVDFGKAACWTAVTNNPGFPSQYAYITNTGSASISGFSIGSNGSLMLLNPDGITFQLPHGADPLDMAVSADSNYLYALEGTFGGIVGFRIQADGSLVQVTNPLGTPTSSYGIAGN